MPPRCSQFLWDIERPIALDVRRLSAAGAGRRSWRRRLRVIVVCSFLAAAGCSKSSLLEISGQVLVDGKPLAEGAIEFYPVNKKGPLTAGSISDGSYKTRAMPGPKIVRIQAFRKSGELDMGGGTFVALKEQTLPARYNAESDLKLEITREQTRYDFKLFSTQ